MNYYVERKGVRALCRQGTSDEFVVKEVLSGEYRKLQIKPGDIVADIGMNIGIFSLFAANRGAAKVVGFEPDGDNFVLAKHNIEINGRAAIVHPYSLAVVGTEDKHRAFSLNVKKNKGAHSLVAKRGRKTVKVSCININDVIKKYEPSIIKMDIEGGEYECLPAVKSFTGVRELILEFHHAHLNDVKTHAKYIEILTLLRSKFKTVVYRDPSVIGGAWTGIVYCNQG